MNPDRWLASGLVPDFLIRLGIRRAIAERLAEDPGTPEGRHAKLDSHVRMLRESPLAVHTDDANAQHYEVPAEFFRIVLGPRLKYSCAWWPEGVETLAEAEEAMLRLTCERARLEDGQRVLELGCGWGSLSLWMAEHYPNSRITAVSNSASQRKHIEGRARELGLSNLEVLTRDVRELELNGPFDRVVSVEMFEHMRNYEELMRRIARWLAPGGMLFVHVFSHAHMAYVFEDKGPNDWMARHFFTGGQMPADDLLPRFQNDLELVERWVFDGNHYRRTAEAWLGNMDRNGKRVRPIFAATYGAENAARFFAYWRIFFMACAEVWGFRKGSEWLVSHYLFRKT
jgi:cyclopropane-fatty-acyl-phospholipid synthase